MWRSFLVLTSALPTMVCAAETIHIDPLASGAGDGTSWADAYTTLAEGLADVGFGDVILTRGTFYEQESSETGANWSFVTWIGDSDPDRPTWIRADRTTDAWVADAASAVGGVTLDGTGGVASVVWDYQQDVDGSATGIAGAWYGHLRRVDDAALVRTTPGTWHYDADTDRLHASPPAGESWSATRAAWCVTDSAVTILNANDTVIAGVNTMLYCDPEPSKGYGLRMSTCFGCTIERATIVDSGYHVAGYVGQNCYNNHMRDIVGWGQQAEVNGEPVTAIAYVFYSSKHVPQSACTAEGLVFHGYPRLGVDGRPLLESYGCNLGYSHTTGFDADGEVWLGDLEWRSCVLLSRERDLNLRHGLAMSWTGNFISARDTPRFFDESDPDAYPIRVIDGLAISRSPAIGARISARNCILDSTGFADVAPQQAVRALRLDYGEELYLTGCVIAFDGGDRSTYRFYDLTDNAQLYLDLCTLRSDYDGPLFHRSIFLRFSSPDVRVRARQTIFSRASEGDLFFTISGGISSETLETVGCWYHGIADNGYAYGNPDDQRDRAWFAATFADDVASVFDVAPELAPSPTAGVEPAEGGTLSRARRRVPALDGIVDLVGVPYNGGYGAHQPMRGDADGDRDVDLDDLNAVLTRFGNLAEDVGIGADLDGSGSVDLDDLNLVLTFFGDVESE